MRKKAKPFAGLEGLTAIDLKEFDKQFQLTLDERRKEEADRFKPRTSSKVAGECSCGGKIVRVIKTRYEFDSRFGPMRIGGTNPMEAIVTTETFCKSCKLLYSNTGKIEPKKKAARSK